MELTIPSSKTDPFRRGIELTIAAYSDSTCLVYAMQDFLNRDTHRAQHSPLFSIGQSSQEAFTLQYVILTLQNLALIAGLGHSAWNGHSFCQRTATWCYAHVNSSPLLVRGCVTNRKNVCPNSNAHDKYVRSEASVAATQNTGRVHVQRS